MAEEFRLQDPGEGIHEAEIREILVSVGDEIDEGEDILLIETDKAAVEVPSPYSGTVAEIPIHTGDIVEVGDVLMTFSLGDNSGDRAAKQKKKEKESSEDETDSGEAAKDKTDAVAKEDEKAEKRLKEAAASDDEEPSDGGKHEGEGERETGEETEPKREKRSEKSGPVPATPVARRLAKKLGVEIYDVPPTGAKGRVTRDDVQSHAEELERKPKKEGRGQKARTGERPPELPDFSKWGDVERVPLRSVRRATAKRMAKSWSHIPHVTHQDVIDITDLESFRNKHAAKVEADGGKLTITVLAMKAVAAALKSHPRFNASMDEAAEEIVLKRYVNLGIAVDTEKGLLVPVVRDVDRKSLHDLACEVPALADRARDGALDREELTGGTFTITNIGALGGTGFAPIINFPEVAVLGLARAHLEPVVKGNLENYEIVPRMRLPVCLTFDHRVVDGADAARFMNTVTTMLSNPDTLALMA